MLYITDSTKRITFVLQYAFAEHNFSIQFRVSRIEQRELALLS